MQIKSVLTAAVVALGFGLSDIHAQASDTLQGHITQNMNLYPTRNWILKGYVKVDSPYVLSIQPGTVVKGQKSSKGTLAISPGAKLNAVGTAANPITFTSDEPDGQKTRGSWGGIVLLGRATNNKGADVFEAVTDWGHGGTNDNDNSGNIQYVRIDHPGFPVAPDKELNGLTFCSVGRGTTVSYVQVHNGDDDGFEWFAGTVNPDHLIVTNEVDDGFDSDNGFRGTLNYGLVIQGTDADRVRSYIVKTAGGADSVVNFPNEVVGDKLFESSSTKNATSVAPQTNPTWSHITAIDNGKSGGGINLNEHAVGSFDHLLMIGDSSAYAVKLQSSGTNAGILAATPTLKFTKSWLGGTWKTSAGGKFQTDDTSAANLAVINARLNAAFKNTGMPIYKDLGLVNDSLKNDTVGAIQGDNPSLYWYQGWTLANTVSYPKGLDRQTDTLQGHITTNMTLVPNRNWILKGYVKVDSPYVLTIQPGTVVKGQKSSKGTLAIAPGAKLNAVGLVNNPITFTSDEPDGQKTRGSWGGIVLLGRATNNKGADVFEAVTDWGHGGTNDADNSGNLQYIRIDHPGFPVAPDKELNGLTLCSVGSGTTLSYIQVHNGDDDGFEWFAGTVNPDHLIVTNEVDDGFDSDNGFRGTLNYGIVIQGTDADRVRSYIVKTAGGADSVVNFPNEVVGDKLFESSSTKNATSVAPQTNPTWSHITAIDNGKSGGGINLNEHAVGSFDHLLMIGDSSAYAVKLQSSGTNAGILAATPTLKFTKSWLGGTWKTSAGGKFQTDDTSAANLAVINARLNAGFKNTGMPIYKDLGLVNDSLKNDTVGAIQGNDPTTFWYKGWTLQNTVVYPKGLDRTASKIRQETAYAKPGQLFSGRMVGGSLSIQSSFNALATVEILDINGKSVFKSNLRLAQGENILGRPATRGIYFLSIRSGNYTVRQGLRVTE